MHGTGLPLVTPFTGAGDVDGEALADLVGVVEDRGVDFIVPVGSNGESVLLEPAEQTRVVEIVAEAASVPVMAGTGQPSLRHTVAATERAADAGADAALVVTPYYFTHDQATFAEHYRAVADAVELPVYLYSVPSKTGVALQPATVAELASHPNIAGMKDSSGDLAAFHREVALTADEEFDMLVGHGGLFAHALEAGGTGGVLALANVAPERTAEVYDRHRTGQDEEARRVNAELVELNHAVVSEYGVPGLKAAMRLRGLPAGHARPPHRPVGPEVEAELETLVEVAEP